MANCDHCRQELDCTPIDNRFCSLYCHDSWHTDDAMRRLDEEHVAITCPTCHPHGGGDSRCPTCNGGDIITVPRSTALEMGKPILAEPLP